MKIYRCSVLALGLLLLGIAPLRAAPLDPLLITFDEWGHASYSLNGGVTFTLLPQGVVESDPTKGFNGNVLVYNLQPAFTAASISSTFSGDVPIAAFGGGSLSDDLRFTDAAGDRTGTNVPLMIFYSFDSLGAPADVGNISTAFLYTQTPVTTEAANGSFIYDSSGGLGGSVMYDGQSDVPEPASVSMFLLGLGVLGVCVFRYRSVIL
jgi:hypothetical protein